jgi:hypothetical protein
MRDTRPFKGDPNDPNYPAFMRGSAYVDRYVGSANSEIRGLIKSRHIKGENDVLVPFNLVDILKKEYNAQTIASAKDIVEEVNERSVDEIIERYINQVKTDGVPAPYDKKVIEALEKLKQPYASNLEEAAAALGIELNPK